MYGEFSAWETQTMMDRTYLQTVVDKMMQSDDTRQMMMKTIDEYRAKMRK
jgi:hypothetical protein